MSQKRRRKIDQDHDLRSVDAHGSSELEQERPEKEKEQGSRQQTKRRVYPYKRTINNRSKRNSKSSPAAAKTTGNA